MLKRISIVLFAFILLLFLNPEIANASDGLLKIRGYQFGKIWYPLTHPSGTPPLPFYATTRLYSSLKSTTNFGHAGVVNCIVDVKSDIDVVRSGSLVDSDGNLLVDVFWGGAKFTNLTTEEAEELAKFVKAGGVLYISGIGWADPGTPGRGAEYNLLFQSLGIDDRFGTQRIFEGNNGQSSVPVETPITTGPFGNVGQLTHGNITLFNKSTLDGIARGYLDSEYLIHEKKIGKGYLAVTGYLSFVDNHLVDPDNLTYYLNLFSLGCRDDWRDNSKVLDVPSFKQGLMAYDGLEPIWENAIYDDGHKQSLFCDSDSNGATMAECGCALTSAAMVMKYFGVNNLANGNGLSPGNLNEYFKQNSQQAGGIYASQGFIGGNINWHAVDNATALANRIYPTQTKLDQPTREDFNVDSIKQYIDQNIPVILKVIGRWGIHWVVVKGYDPGTNRLIINDPIQQDKASGLTYLDEQYAPAPTDSMVVYKETHSDFSSFQVSSISPISITDQFGNAIGEYSFDEFYGDATSESLLLPSENGIYSAIARTPEDGNLIISTSGDPLVIATSNIAGDTVSSVIEQPVENEEYIFVYSEETAGEEIIQLIDIGVKANSNSKWININNRSVLHATIFSSETFDATSIDQSSIRFGKTGEEMSLKSCDKKLEDMNGDELGDLTCMFEMEKTGFDIYTQFAILTAKSSDGFGLQGIGEITVAR